MEGKASAILLSIGLALGVHLIVSSVYDSTKVPPPKAATSAPVTAIAAVVDFDENTGADTKPKPEKGLRIEPGDRNRRQLDLAFCIDATSSMQGEIDTVKRTVKSTVEKLSHDHGNTVVRVGLVAYRDLGDDFVTRVYPFSTDIAKVQRDISELQASGGGDGPEAVDEGLHSALNELKWDADRKTAKLLFLIGDAPAHRDRHTVDWKADSHKASLKGIRISTIGCAGLEDYQGDGPAMFQQIATMTNGSFSSLVYHQEVADSHGKVTTLISSAGKTFTVKPDAKDKWKDGVEDLMSKGMATATKGAVFAMSAAPALQGATNGTIGPFGGDATYVSGINTAGVVRSDNNLDAVMLQGAHRAVNDSH